MTMVAVVVGVAVGLALTILVIRRRAHRPPADARTGIGIVFLAVGLGTAPTIGVEMIGLAGVGLAGVGLAILAAEAVRR